MKTLVSAHDILAGEYWCPSENRSPDECYPLILDATRIDLAWLLGLLEFKIGAELGVERGKYSEVLCEGVPGLHLICVDSWASSQGYREHVSESDLDRFYEETQARLSRFDVEIVRKWGVAAAREIPDASLDFVYIDANHEYSHVRNDIYYWAPKVRTGGIVAGHDFNRSGVKRAVAEYTAAHEIAPWFVLTGDRSPSWFWVQA